MSHIDTERREIYDFSISVEAEAARHLKLLKDIESTLAWLTRLTSQLKADISFGESLAAELSAFDEPIDPDCTLTDSMLSAQQGIDALYNLLIIKRQTGRDDRELKDSDGIEDAYTEAIAAAADLHNLLNTIRWSIGEHDVDVMPQTANKTYAVEDIDKMFDDILSS